MAREVRDYAGGAVDTTLSAGINSTDLSISIASSTGWPTGGANGPFFVIIDYDVAGKEKVEVASRTGTTLTVASVGKRGIDNTAAAAHASGAKIRHCITAQDFNEFNDHAFDVTKDDHTQYLNTTRHDVTARHTIGSVIAAAAPGTITPDDVAAAGVANSVARSDHRHAITAAAASTVTGANGEGVAATFARADHNHAIGGTNHIPVAAMVNGSIANGAAALATGQKFTYVQAGDPGAVGNGSVWFDTTNRQIKIRNAADTGWEVFGELVQPFEDYTPSFPMVVLGTGGHKYGRIWRLGDLVVGIAGFTLGSGTGNVTSTIKVDVPHTLVQPGSERFSWMAGGRAIDASAGATYAGIAMVDHNTDSSSFSGFATAGATASWDNNTPFDWTDSDHFHAFFMAEKV